MHLVKKSQFSLWLFYCPPNIFGAFFVPIVPNEPLFTLIILIKNQKLNMNLFTKRTLTISAIVIAFILGIAANKKAESGKYFEISKNLEIFTNMYKELNTYYVDDVDPAGLMRTGIDAMLKSLDPYTNYFSESQIEGFRFITEGKYNGIGAEFDKIKEDIVVISPIDGSPAMKAGLKAGDKVISIDGTSVKGKSVDQLGDFIKGAPGTDVVLSIARPTLTDKYEELKIKVVREEVIEKNVPYSGMITEDVGYIILTTFSREAGANVAEALKTLKTKNPKMSKLILDLRGNGGGLLAEAVNLCNVFIPRGELVVTTKGKVVDWDRSYRTLNPSIDETMPVAILVDKGTASASEIVSGTLQDVDRAVVIGQKTYGKGLVQNTREIGYNSKLKLTTSKYYIPSGRCIQAVRYEKGEPVELPDSLSSKFKTRKGRTVLDGGGIKPDIILEAKDKYEVIKALREQRMIFQYVTKYVLKNPTPVEPEKFEFTDFDDFVAFLSTQKFDYETESEKSLKKVRIEATNENYISVLTEELKNLENKISQEKKNEVVKHKAEILKGIEREIASRYFYDIGEIKMRLKNDDEIKQATSLLNDANKYNAILKK
jgi:carboxyl-terminal processing protease